MSVLSYISLSVAVSEDGAAWRDCCGEGDTSDTTHFYLDDRKDEADQVQSSLITSSVLLTCAMYINLC